MEKIYAPWREKYIKKAVQKTNSERIKADCLFCHQLKQNKDEEFYIIKRFKHTFVILNLYPYNGGHLLVLPIEHNGTLQDCSQNTRSELIETVNISMQVLKKTLQPQGFNVGLNLGQAGGGGIPSHLHFHVLPRWEGDTNFLPLTCDTKTISTDLKELYQTLKKEF